MKQRARLIVPVWGDFYAQKLVSVTLPALLASGNLPALTQTCDLDVVLVTETRLFERIKAAQSFVFLARLCDVRLMPIDDLLTDRPSDYGVVLTFALHRGFSDLGEQMTATYLLFLNADFIVSNAALGHLGSLIAEGHRVIHAPSFRVVLEEVLPVLESAVDPATQVLSIPSRELVRLALHHKHLTVRARTVNQRLFHQWRMDQFYWYVDESALVGYQWPVALVAIRPQRVVTEPSLVWDYGFIPDAAPDATPYFISDSDNFFMLELQRRYSGNDLIRLGWISTRDIARDLSKWTTKAQRESGKQRLLIHAGELPANLPEVTEESLRYIDEIYNQLDPEPQSHHSHAMLQSWFSEVTDRIQQGGRSGAKPGQQCNRNGPQAASASSGLRLSNLLRRIYRAVFGEMPAVNRSHPMWVDTHVVADVLQGWRTAGRSILWVCSTDSFYHRWLRGRLDPLDILTDSKEPNPRLASCFDACLCELRPEELPRLKELYELLRPSLRDGAEVLIYIFNQQNQPVRENDVQLCDLAFPASDLSELQFFGSRLVALWRDLLLRATTAQFRNPLWSELLSAAVLVVLAPLVRISNTAAAEGRMTPSGTWTSLVIQMKVQRSGSALIWSQRSQSVGYNETIGHDAHNHED